MSNGSPQSLPNLPNSSTALVPSPASLPTAKSLKSFVPRQTDRRRWLMKASGLSPEEIAARQGVSLLCVQDSLMKMSMYMQANSHAVVDARVNELALSKLDKAEKLLDEAFNAIKVYEGRVVVDVAGQPIRDIEVGFKAIRAIRDLIDTIRPKGPGVALQVNSNSNNTTINQSAPVVSYEERLRAIRERHGMKNEEYVPTIDAETVAEGNIHDESAEDFEEEDEEIAEGETVEEGSEEGEGQREETSQTPTPTPST